MAILNEIIASALKGERDEPLLEFRDHWLPRGALAAVAAEVDQRLLLTDSPHEAPIAIIPRNRPAFVAAISAVVGSGRSILMIYAFQSPEAVAADVRRLRPAVVVADEQDWADAVREAAREVGSAGIVLRDHAAPENAVGFVSGLEQTDPAVEHHPPFAAPGIEMLTSGTTGAPKRFHLGYDLIERSMVLEHTQYASDSITNSPPAVAMFPFGNISGLYSLFPLLAARKRFVLLEKFTVEAWLSAVQRYRLPRIALPPAGFCMLLDADPPLSALESLEFINTGAAHLPVEVQEEFEAKFGIPVLTSYGATEFGGPVTNMTLELRRRWGDRKLGSVGLPWAGAELRVVDGDSGAELPRGSVGILEVRTPRMGGDWIRTSDVAMIDADGFVFHRGRADGAITRGGFKILPETVNSAFESHPSVAAAATVAAPDRRLGQVPVTAVELRVGAPAVSAEALLEHARKHLYATHVPVRVRIIDALPRTPSMKVSLVDVRALMADVEGR